MCVEDQEGFKEKIFSTAKILLDELYQKEFHEPIYIDDLMGLILELARIPDDTRRNEVLEFVKKQALSVNYSAGDLLYHIVRSIPGVHSIPPKLLDEALIFAQKFNKYSSLSDLNHIASAAKWLPQEQREIAEKISGLEDIKDGKVDFSIDSFHSMLALLAHNPGSESLSTQLPNDVLKIILNLLTLLDKKDENQNGSS